MPSRLTRPARAHLERARAVGAQHRRLFATATPSRPAPTLQIVEIVPVLGLAYTPTKLRRGGLSLHAISEQQEDYLARLRDPSGRRLCSAEDRMSPAFGPFDQKLLAPRKCPSVSAPALGPYDLAAPHPVPWQRSFSQTAIHLSRLSSVFASALFF